MRVLPPHTDIASFQVLLNSTDWMKGMQRKFQSTSLLHEMISSNEDFQLVKLLITTHSTMKLKKSKLGGLLPIMTAVNCQNLRIVKLLLQSHVEEQCESRPSLRCAESYTPFIQAVRLNNIKIARQLFRSGSNVNAVMTLKENEEHHPIGSSLYLMSQRHSEFPGIQMMNILVHEFGANPNCTATFRSMFGVEKNRTALFGAVSRDDIEMTKLLLSYGCDIDARDSSGRTALWMTFGTMRGMTTKESRVSSPDTALMLVQQFGASLKKCYGGKRHVGSEINGRFLETIEGVNEAIGAAQIPKDDTTYNARRAETLRLEHVLQKFQKCSQGRIKCDVKETKNRWCSRCKTVSYCCQEHQRDDWKTHKITCKEIQKYRKLVKKVKRIDGFPIVKVQIQDLKSKPEWNGLIGTRSMFNQTKNRYLIVFDDLSLPNVHMKKSNLVVLDDNGKMNDEQQRINTLAIEGMKKMEMEMDEVDKEKKSRPNQKNHLVDVEVTTEAVTAAGEQWNVVFNAVENDANLRRAKSLLENKKNPWTKLRLKKEIKKLKKETKKLKKQVANFQKLKHEKYHHSNAPAGFITQSPAIIELMMQGTSGIPRQFANLIANSDGFVEVFHHVDQDDGETTVLFRVSEEYEREYAKMYIQPNGVVEHDDLEVVQRCHDDGLAQPDWSPYVLVNGVVESVSARGRTRSVNGGGTNTWDGYLLHMCVAMFHVEEQPSPQHFLRHIDGNPLNNWANNLKWIL